jgi:hypothetical protein
MALNVLLLLWNLCNDFLYAITEAFSEISEIQQLKCFVYFIAVNHPKDQICWKIHYIQFSVHRFRPHKLLLLWAKSLLVKPCKIAPRKLRITELKETNSAVLPNVWLKTKTKLRGLYSASELYRPRDRRMSANLVPTFANRGCHVVRATDPYGRSFRFPRPEPLLFNSSSSRIILTRLSWPGSRPTTFPGNLIAPGIEPGNSRPVARNSEY